MRARTNLVLDSVIAAAFLVAANPSLVGLTVHEWFGLAFAAAVVAHLVLHWEWSVAATKRLFARRAKCVGLNDVVDLFLFVSLTATILSGLLTSRHVVASLGLSLQPDRAWREIHSLAANASIAGMGVHLGLHWNWIAANLPRLLGASARSAGRRRAPVRQSSGGGESCPSAVR